MSVRVLHGDMLAILPTLPAESFDAVCCDPPYHLTSIVKRFGSSNAAPAKHGTDGAFARASRGFMGKQWDGGDIAFRPATWVEVLRVMKPGAYLIAFSSSRTFGRMQVALEDAGAITHPMIGWIFGQGFPKAHKVDAPGAEGLRYGLQALKPALEPIYMGQKPMEGTGTANWLKHGTGALNIDACRVQFASDDDMAAAAAAAAALRVCHDEPGQVMKGLGKTGFTNPRASIGPYLDNVHKGRWPANLAHDGTPEVMEAFAAFGEAPGQQRVVGPEHGAKDSVNCYGDFGARDTFRPRGDAGSAARFFYTAKADAQDRLGSRHPTVKPVSLIRWLLRLITPPGGHVLDGFAGSGTTGMAAMAEGFSATLIEREAEYVKDIERRVAHVSGEDTPLFAGVEA